MEALILFNFSMLIVSIFVLRRFPRGLLKTLFLTFAAAFVSYAAPAIALGELRPSGEAAVLLSRLLLLGGACTIGSLFALLLAYLNADSLSSWSVRSLIFLPPAAGVCLAFAPESWMRAVLENDLFLLSSVGGVFFFVFYFYNKKGETDFERFRARLLAWSVAPGLLLFFAGAALLPKLFDSAPVLPGPFLLLFAVPGMYLAMRLNKQLYVMRRLDEDCRDPDLLFEDRFPDLVRGVGALRDVLLDRKINTGRLLILNSEENLSIERTSSQEETSTADFPCGQQCKPLAHLAGVLENYTRLERRVSLMNFALMRYESMALEQEEAEAKRRIEEAAVDQRGPGLRIKDPLLVLYHYLAEPDHAFPLTDALDVIEREELHHLFRSGLVVRRPGAGLVLSRQALARVEGQTGVLTTSR